MNIIDQTVSDIKSLKIQGATNILKVSLSALKQLVKENPQITLTEFNTQVDLLKTARPTEPLTENCLSLINRTIEPKNLEKNLIKAIEDVEIILGRIEEKIIANAALLLKDKNKFLTHCHSKTVEKVLIDLARKNFRIEIFATETRPLFQGRITVLHLIENSVKTTLLTDSLAPFLISQKKVEAILIGADEICPDGAVVNKVGSFGICLSAWRENIPVYIACSLLKYSHIELNIEDRNPKEVWDNPPANLMILNPAFDKIPAKFITGLITEAGVIKPQDIKTKVQEFYPWIDT